MYTDYEIIRSFHLGQLKINLNLSILIKTHYI